MAEREPNAEDSKEVVQYGRDGWDVAAGGMEGTRLGERSEVDNGCTGPCVGGSTVVDTWGAASWASSCSGTEDHGADRPEKVAWATDVARRDGGFAA